MEDRRASSLFRRPFHAEAGCCQPCSNAVKFTRLRTQAEIEVGSVAGNKNEVEVFVRDNGAGFDMQYVNSCSAYFNACILLNSLKAPE